MSKYLLAIIITVNKLADFIAAILMIILDNKNKLSKKAFVIIVSITSFVFISSFISSAVNLYQMQSNIDTSTNDSSYKETSDSIDNTDSDASTDETNKKDNQKDEIKTNLESESDKYRKYYDSLCTEIATQINNNRYTDMDFIKLSRSITNEYFNSRFAFIDKPSEDLNSMNLELNDNISISSFFKNLTDGQYEYEQRTSELVYGYNGFCESDLLLINSHISEYNSINEKLGFDVPFIVNRLMLDYTTKSIILNKYKDLLAEQGIIDKYENPVELVKESYLDAITYQLYDMAYGNHKYDKCGFEHNNAITEYYFAMTNYNLAQTVEDEVHKAAYYCISILFFEESAESNLPPEYTPQHNLSQVYYELSLLPINGKNNSYYRQMSDYYAEF